VVLQAEQRAEQRREHLLEQRLEQRLKERAEQRRIEVKIEVEVQVGIERKTQLTMQVSIQPATLLPVLRDEQRAVLREIDASLRRGAAERVSQLSGRSSRVSSRRALIVVEEHPSDGAACSGGRVTGYGPCGRGWA
jgi:hypothetical protein